MRILLDTPVAELPQGVRLLSVQLAKASRYSHTITIYPSLSILDTSVYFTMKYSRWPLAANR